MNGSAKEILVKKTQTVEGKSNDYKSIFLFFGEQNVLCINFGEKNKRKKKSSLEIIMQIQSKNYSCNDYK